jgi:hypothetical protein
VSEERLTYLLGLPETCSFQMVIGSRITKASWRTDSTDCRRTFLDSGLVAASDLKHSSKFRERVNSRGGALSSAASAQQDALALEPFYGDEHLPS